MAPRDVVATAIVDGDELVASVSSWARSLRVRKAKTLTATAGLPGFAVCPGEVLQLAPGRNYFGDAGTGRYAVRCRAGLVEPDGHPLRVRAELSLANKLDIALERCATTNLGCQPIARYDYNAVGVAFDVTDVERDGKPEVIYAAAGAPGDPDVLKVVTIGDDDRKCHGSLHP